MTYGVWMVRPGLLWKAGGYAVAGWRGPVWCKHMYRKDFCHANGSRQSTVLGATAPGLRKRS